MRFSDQRPAADATGEHAPKEEVMLLHAGVGLPPENALNTVKEAFRDERLVDAGIGLAGDLDPHEADVEGVVEDVRETVNGDLPSAFGPQSYPVRFFHEPLQVVPPRGIPFEDVPD